MTSPQQTVASVTKLLQLVFFAAAILYFGKTLFIPLFFGLLVAMVMYPVCKGLERKGWSRTLATTVSLSIVALLFLMLLALLAWQVSAFWHDWPQIARKLEILLLDVQTWIAEQAGVTLDVQTNWLRNVAMNAGNIVSNMLRGTLSTTMNVFFMLFMVPVFAALFLYHRRVFVQYLRVVVGPAYRERLDRILQEVIHTYFNYIKGMILVYIIVGALNSIGLLALGIRHAVLFGMLTAIMTIIPYIGIVASALLPISVAWTTKGSIWYPLGVVGVFSFVQYLEANVIFPKVVGAQLNVSTWATLVAILAGGILWGVSGMVLFIPFVAILKIVTDHVGEWKGLNLLLSRTP
ncbi:AI-2E family transporter [Chitinophaga japonensis]|uniref:Putative PurR-regulated permease PerM n=1 Tax=Chitinophaga japonensis TaxID=104662 RepID=A0A562SS69_CHIJA|nr:AI-2E family transporter [Chitinophaga japonensis]TWI84109.1 putative PurR-regulated permease PerM [Chitinophaga japonensis]